MKKVIKFILICVFFILLIGSYPVVFGAEDIQIKISANTTEFTTSDVMLIIDISNNKTFEVGSNQSVQILLGDESTTNKWVDLGTGTNGDALKKSYNYVVKNNAKISARVVSWKQADKSDLKQLAIQTYEVSNIDKTNPVIEKIDTVVSNNSISLDIIAKDTEVGISKYSCTCEAISSNKTSETSKFEFSNLEENKEYTFIIIVEDKLGNKATETKTITTKLSNAQNVSNTNLNTDSNLENEFEDNNIDNTIANKIIPQIGKSNLFFAIALVVLISIIFIKTKDRI